MYQFLLITIVVISCLLIFLVLMQQGKGADAGAAFGSGASGTVFGAQGTGTFLSRVTSILAAIFFVVCLAMAALISKQTSGNAEEESVMDSVLESNAVQDLPNVPNANGAVQLPGGGDIPADLPSTAAPQVSDVPTVSDVPSAVDVPSVPDVPVATDLPAAGDLGAVVNDGLEGVSDTVTNIVNDAAGAVDTAVDLPSDLPQLDIEAPVAPVLE